MSENKKKTTQDNADPAMSWMSENKLITTIIAAAIIIAGALVFLGISLGSGSGSSAGNDGATFAEQLETYMAQQEQQQIQAQEDAEAERAKLAENVPAIGEQDHVIGAADAVISLIEYSDFECPFCKQFYKTPKQVVANNPGTVNATFRHFALDFHNPHATDAAMASECAADQGGSDAFWEFHDRYFEATESNKGFERSGLSGLASGIGLDGAALMNCVDSGKYAAKVAADLESGVASGVTGTPGTIIRNNDTGSVRLIAGAYPIEALQAAIDELLAE